MTDLNERLRGIDRLNPPDLLEEARKKASTDQMHSAGPSAVRRFAIVASTMAIGLAGVAIAISAFTSQDARGPLTPPAQNGDVSETATPVRIPDVLGMTLDEATATITSSGLGVGTIEHIPSSTVPEGSVVSTNPLAGTEAELPPRFEVAIILSSGPDDEGPISLPGLDAYQVCRITRMQGDFGSAGDEVVVFEEERVPGAGCTQSEGFQHIAVLRGGEVTALSRRVTDIVSDDAWKVWPYATPDLDGDGIDEIVLATVRAGSGRHLWFFKVQSGGIDPVSEGGAAFNIVIGTAAHENGTQAAQGLYCEGSDDSRTVVIWQAGAADALEVSESVWRLDGVTMRLVVERATRISGASAYPPLGDVELCGSPVAGKG